MPTNHHAHKKKNNNNKPVAELQNSGCIRKEVILRKLCCVIDLVIFLV